MSTSRRLSRLVAAVVLTAAVGVPVLTSAPAQAAACSGSTGVTVVVDPHQLGGGVDERCAGSSATASSLFTGVGFSLDRVQRFPGFICRIDGAPASDPCINTPPASAYWSLWWTDGTTSSWTYSALGADSLRVPVGGSVAFSWNQGDGGNIQPGVAPAVRVGASSPTPAARPSAAASEESSSGKGSDEGTGPTTGSGKKPGGTATKRPPSATPSPRASAKPSTSTASSAGATTAATGTATTGTDGASGAPTTAPTTAPAAATSTAPGGEVATAVPDQTGSASAAPPVSDAQTVPTSATPVQGGLPAWVVPALLVVLLAAAGLVALARRRRSLTD